MVKPKNTELSKYIQDLTGWIEERKKAIDYSLEQFDKLIITLSSGSLVFSVGFVKDIVKITEKTNTQFLKISWGLFALSLISVLISHITAYKTNRIETDLSKSRFLIKLFNCSTKTSNTISFLSLFIGIVFFILFINHNI